VEGVINKTDVLVSLDNSRRETPLLLVTVRAEPIRSGSVKAMEIFVEAALLGSESEKGSENKSVVIWSGGEAEIGTVVPAAVAQGRVSRVFSEKLIRFFNKFNTAQAKAKRLLK